MKIILCKNFSKSISLLIPLISLVSLNCDFLNAEYLIEELQIDTSTKTDDDSSSIPSIGVFATLSAALLALMPRKKRS